jgi:hypothetical protein
MIAAWRTRGGWIGGWTSIAAQTVPPRAGSQWQPWVEHVTLVHIASIGGKFRENITTADGEGVT